MLFQPPPVLLVRYEAFMKHFVSLSARTLRQEAAKRAIAG